jgi:hypothetical protein
MVEDVSETVMGMIDVKELTGRTRRYWKSSWNQSGFFCKRIHHVVRKSEENAISRFSGGKMSARFSRAPSKHQ